MTLKEFLSVLNMQILYRVTDRNTKETIVLTENGKPIKEVMQRNIYMVFQDDNGTLNITLY